MKRFLASCAGLLALGFAAACGRDAPSRQVTSPDLMANGAASADNSASDDDGFTGKRNIAMRDDCDPRDPAWAPVGCFQRRGDVTVAEFNAENNSTLSLSVIGHQAWRMDPSYLKIVSGKTLRVRNEGGRPHTFTKVAMFGGGRVPDPTLNKGLTTAPECLGNAPNIRPGESAEITGLTVGNNRFQCCNHPWMRAIIKVRANDDHGDHDD
jgi:plastocyanin